MRQSTNDVYPTAVKVALRLVRRAPARGDGACCADAFAAKADEFAAW